MGSLAAASYRVGLFGLPVTATLLIYAGLVGWGWIVVQVLRSTRAPHTGMLGAWGLAFTCVVGGLLNLLGVISPSLLRIYIALGALVAVAIVCRKVLNLARRGFAIDRVSRPLLAAGTVAVAIMALLAIGGGATRAFNQHDDFHAYLSFPVKMVQTGSMGHDPFAERRMLEYGGQSFLHALMLGLVDLNQLHLIEYGVAPLLVIGLLVGHACSRGANALVGLLTSAFFLISPPPLENITSVMTGLVLFYALMQELAEPDRELGFRRIAPVSLLVTGLLALKNSHAPAVGLLLMTYFLTDQRPILTRAKEMAALGVAVALLLMPWMLSMAASSGTPFYPLLGRGYSGSVYSRFVPVNCGTWSGSTILRGLAGLIGSREMRSGLLLVIIVGLSVRGGPSGKRTAIWYSCAAYVAAVALDVASGGIGLRYAYAFMFAAMLFMVTEALGPEAPGTRAWVRVPNWAVPAAATLTIAWLVSSNVQSGVVRQSLVGWGYDALTSGVSSATDVHAGAAQLRGAQTFVPAGQPVLARLSRPFNLNFARNVVYLVDWPGGASPPPGMPIERTAEALAEYLRAHSIRYVMYSYGDEANYAFRRFRHRLRQGDDYVARARVTTELTFAFQTRLAELSKAYEVLVDDGLVFVLDLERPRR